MTAYAKRENVFEKAERVWTVGEDALVWRRPGRGAARMAWTEVAALAVAYAPTRLKADRHRLTLRAADGRAWTVDNMSFRGVGDFEDRSETFTPFALACVARVAAASPGAKARIGATALEYWGQLAFVGAMFALLAVVILALPVTFGGVFWVKLAVIAGMLPVLVRWIVAARPRTVALDPEAFREALP